MTGEKMRLGIDVGGTNTDAALLRGGEVISSAKSFTTDDVRDGVIESVNRILATPGIVREDIGAVMIGTTQFVNAFVQRRGLSRVAAIRVALPMGDGVPPFSGWPDDAVDAVCGQRFMVGGGAYFTGKDYAAVDEDAVLHAAQQSANDGIHAFAVSCSFAPIRPDIEQRVAALISRVVPDARITLSSEVGGMGLVDRENAAIINACLSQLAGIVITSLRRAMEDLRIAAPLYISQNDGTLISADAAAKFPIFTCSAGPTNSIRGAAFLTGLKDAIVVDIGGTTSDVGFLRNGFPRETTSPNPLGGVRTNFRMPDVLSIGVGGGSLVTEVDGKWRVGPRSVGYRLQQEGRVFGGGTLTASDIAVRAGQAAIGDPALVAEVSDATVTAVLDDLHAQIEDAIDQVKVSADPQPLILVGGGSILVSRDVKGASEVLRPPHSGVANAIGAAIALVSGRVNRLFDFKAIGRESALEDARQEAIAAAVAAGARHDEVEVIDIQELPMTHMQSGAVQVKVVAVGPLAAFA